MRALFLLIFVMCGASVHGWAGVTTTDALGRAFASAGSEPDSISVEGHAFATGFHKIQGLAWHGRDLWVSNSPDLTIVRDTNNDGKADDYVLVARHLGDENQGLHGIAWGADGKLYLATGALALMPEKALGRSMTFHQSEYTAFPFAMPQGLKTEGAILCCDADGRSLKVVSRSLDNPKGVWFDDAFRPVTRIVSAAPSWSGSDEKRKRSYDQWTFEELASDLGSSNEAASVAAEEELVRRGESIKVGMLTWLDGQDLSQRQRTWALWTLGRAGKDDVEIEAYFASQLKRSKDANTRLQCLRIIDFRMKEFGFTKELPQAVKEAVNDPDAEVREMAQSLVR